MIKAVKDLVLFHTDINREAGLSLCYHNAKLQRDHNNCELLCK